jgi:hypothetical protein
MFANKCLVMFASVYRSLGPHFIQLYKLRVHLCNFWLTCNTITRRPSLLSSSVSRAHFVTAGAIGPKLCTYVPLGKSNSRTKFRSSLILGSKTEKKLYNSLANGWIISKFLSWVYLIRIHDILPGFFI